MRRWATYFFLPFFAPFFAFFAFLPFLAAMVLVPFSDFTDLFVWRCLCFFAARFALAGIARDAPLDGLASEAGARAPERATLAGPPAPLPTAWFRAVRGTASR